MPWTTRPGLVYFVVSFVVISEMRISLWAGVSCFLCLSKGDCSNKHSGLSLYFCPPVVTLTYLKLHKRWATKAFTRENEPSIKNRHMTVSLTNCTMGLEMWKIFLRECFITFLDTSKFIKNTPLRVVISTRFYVFGNAMKQVLSCLIHYINTISVCTVSLQK